MGVESDAGFINNCFWNGIPIPCGFCGLDLGNTTEIAEILREDPSTWGDKIHEYQTSTDLCHGGTSQDRLGLINKIYTPTDWEEGAHTNVVSSNGDFTLRYTIIVTRPPEVEQPDTDRCSIDPPIRNTAVTSTSSQPTFPPTNAIDGNLNTRWVSTLMPNPSVTLELVTDVNNICGVEVAIADGNVHQYKFTVSVSDDGINFADVISGISKGTTTDFEKYNFPQDVENKKFVRITVTESRPNFPSSIAQISEVRALGTIAIIINPDEQLSCPPLCFPQ